MDGSLGNGRMENGENKSPLERKRGAVASSQRPERVHIISRYPRLLRV